MGSSLVTVADSLATSEHRQRVSPWGIIVSTSSIAVAIVLGLCVAFPVVAQAPDPTPPESSEELRRMSDEIRALKNERGSWEKKLEDAERKYEKQAVEILDLREELDEMRSSNEKNMESSKELRDTKRQLRECKDELKGLRVTLGDMMEEHEMFKKRAGNMNDRLGSLSLSLETMMDRQDHLVRSLRQRDENRKQALQYRQEKLKQLCELETLCDNDDDRSIDSAFKKQTKEMEALAAVIAAARE